MTHDYSKDLTLIVTGSGVINQHLVEQALDPYIFGTLQSREVRAIVPMDHAISKGLEHFLNWAVQTGIDLTLIKFANNSSSYETHADNVFSVSSMSEMVDATFGEIAQANIMNNHETAFIGIFNPDSAIDLEWVTAAKQYEWLTTLNLASGLVDHFDGYESTDEKMARLDAEQKTAELEQQEKEEAKAAKKTAAKKTTAPRKRAAKKVEAEESKPLGIEPEKPLVESSVDKGWGEHTHYFIWVDDNKGREGMFCRHCGISESDDNSEKPANYALSGEIVMNTPKLPDDLEPAKLIDPTPDVWKDVAAAIPEGATHFAVRKEDIVELGEAMEEMATAFGKAIRVYKNIVETK